MNSSNILSDGYNLIGAKELDQQNWNQEFSNLSIDNNINAIDLSTKKYSEDNLQESILSFQHQQIQSPKNLAINESISTINVKPKQKLIKSPLQESSQAKSLLTEIYLKKQHFYQQDKQFKQLLDYKQYYEDQLNEKDQQIQYLKQSFNQIYDQFYGQDAYNQGFVDDYQQSQAENQQLQSQLVELQDKNSTLQNLNQEITLNCEKITEQNRNLLNENECLKSQILYLKIQFGLDKD